MSYAEAKAFDASFIPVVDISVLIEADTDFSNDNTNNHEHNALHNVAKALCAASQNPGFIYISGHGIPDDIIDAARQQALTFFRQSDAQKSAVSISPRHRGWLAQGGAKMQDDVVADLKESFLWGYQDADGHTPEDHPIRGANHWPTSVPELQPAAVAYYQHAERVAMCLLRGFAQGMGLSADFFLRRCERPLSRASFVYYPAQPEALGSRQFGVGPHTDFGVLTVLCQDDVGGLQVQTPDGDWIHAPPIPGTLVVNVGDLLARWTDDHCRSTPHRVVNSSGRERLSLVLAFDPDPETSIDAREVHGIDYPAAHDPITCGDYLIWRFGKAFSYRGQTAAAAFMHYALASRSCRTIAGGRT